MTEEELQSRLEATLPLSDLHGLFVEECQDDIRLRFSPGPDGLWPTTALLSIVDTALRAAAGLDTQLAHLNATLLRAAQPADVIALSRVVRRDGAASYAEAWLFSHAVVEPILHATGSLVRTPLRA